MPKFIVTVKSNGLLPNFFDKWEGKSAVVYSAHEKQPTIEEIKEGFIDKYGTYPDGWVCTFHYERVS